MITPRIKEVKALTNRKIYIVFEDGIKKIYDMNDIIQSNPFYNKLKNDEYFNKVKPRGTSVEWPDGEDVCPENLYNESEDFIN
jgi:hypothetical protein